MGYSRRGECAAHVGGGGYGFSCSTRYYRCLAKRWQHGILIYTKYETHVLMRLSGGSMISIAGRLIPGGLSYTVVSCHHHPLSKALAMPSDKVIVRILPIIVSTHLSVMTVQSCFANNLVARDGRYVIILPS